jgi:hypothetical protein
MKTRFCKSSAIIFLLIQIALGIDTKLAFGIEDNTSFYVGKYGETYHFYPSNQDYIVILKSFTAFDQFQKKLSRLSTVRFDSSTLYGFFKAPKETNIDEILMQIKGEAEVVEAAPGYFSDDSTLAYLIPTEILVRFKENISRSQVQNILASFGSRVVKTYHTSNFFAISIPKGKGYFESLRELNSLPEILFADAHIIKLDAACDAPFDVHYVDQWHMENFGQLYEECPCDGFTYTHDVDANTAFDIETGVPEVVICIIDTGVDTDHPDLIDNYDGGYDYVNDDPDPNDVVGHGTGCAGIAAAKGNNGIGIAGMAYNCHFIMQKVNLSIWDNGQIADAINDAVNQLPNYTHMVMSFSWSALPDPTLHDAVQNAYNAGILICASAGNDGDDEADYPAKYNEVLGVGATDPCDYRKTPSSCVGGDWGSNYGTGVDVYAPGTLIYTTGLDGSYRDNFSGTSASAPMVAGLAALLWSRDPSKTRDWVRNNIINAADHHGDVPRINAHNSLSVLCEHDLPAEVYDGQGGPLEYGCSPYNIYFHDAVVPAEDNLTMESRASLEFWDDTHGLMATGTFYAYGGNWENPTTFWAHYPRPWGENRIRLYDGHITAQNGCMFKLPNHYQP